jgi:catechol 2,3-dioxygenase-like lactoylglutathione lyase family enzyme
MLSIVINHLSDANGADLVPRASSTIGGMALSLFAGIPVRDYSAAVAWYERLFGGPPTFLAHETEAVWELAEDRWVYVEEQPERAGYAMLTVLVDDLEARVAGIAARGIEPARRERYENGVEKVVYADADGNEFGFGNSPA